MFDITGTEDERLVIFSFDLEFLYQEGLHEKLEII